jgi:hypothetical protein
MSALRRLFFIIAVRLRAKKYVQNLHDLCYKKAIKTIADQGDFEHGPP